MQLKRQSKSIKTVQDLKMEIEKEFVKKTQTVGIMEMKNLTNRTGTTDRHKYHQQSTKEKRKKLRFR